MSAAMVTGGRRRREQAQGNEQRQKKREADCLAVGCCLGLPAHFTRLVGRSFGAVDRDQVPQTMIFRFHPSYDEMPPRPPPAHRTATPYSRQL